MSRTSPNERLAILEQKVSHMEEELDRMAAKVGRRDARDFAAGARRALGGHHGLGAGRIPRRHRALVRRAGVRCVRVMAERRLSVRCVRRALL
jgi:hypothetical protein